MAEDNPSDKQLENTNNKDRPWLWKAGQSGNPAGRPPKGFAITDVLRDMMTEKPEIKKALMAKLIEMALAGDLLAIREILDRIEGKSVQKMGVEEGTDLASLVIIKNGNKTE
jgi:hypothetical protein